MGIETDAIFAGKENRCRFRYVMRSSAIMVRYVSCMQSSNASSDYSAPYCNTLNAARFNSFQWMGDDVQNREISVKLKIKSL